MCLSEIDGRVFKCYGLTNLHGTYGSCKIGLMGVSEWDKYMGVSD